jgi:hypothetical protein
MAEVIDKSSKLEYKTINEPRKSVENKVTVAFIVGPEGLLIELVED